MVRQRLATSANGDEPTGQLCNERTRIKIKIRNKNNHNLNRSSLWLTTSKGKSQAYNFRQVELIKTPNTTTTSNDFTRNINEKYTRASVHNNNCLLVKYHHAHHNSGAKSTLNYCIYRLSSMRTCLMYMCITLVISLALQQTTSDSSAPNELSLGAPAGQQQQYSQQTNDYKILDDDNNDNDDKLAPQQLSHLQHHQRSDSTVSTHDKPARWPGDHQMDNKPPLCDDCLAIPLVAIMGNKQVNGFIIRPAASLRHPGNSNINHQQQSPDGGIHYGQVSGQYQQAARPNYSAYAPPSTTSHVSSPPAPSSSGRSPLEPKSDDKCPMTGPLTVCDQIGSYPADVILNKLEVVKKSLGLTYFNIDSLFSDERDHLSEPFDGPMWQEVGTKPSLVPKIQSNGVTNSTRTPIQSFNHASFHASPNANIDLHYQAKKSTNNNGSAGYQRQHEEHKERIEPGNYGEQQPESDASYGSAAGAGASGATSGATSAVIVDSKGPPLQRGFSDQHQSQLLAVQQQFERPTSNVGAGQGHLQNDSPLLKRLQDANGAGHRSRRLQRQLQPGADEFLHLVERQAISIVAQQPSNLDHPERQQYQLAIDYDDNYNAKGSLESHEPASASIANSQSSLYASGTESKSTLLISSGGGDSSAGDTRRVAANRSRSSAPLFVPSDVVGDDDHQDSTSTISKVSASHNVSSRAANLSTSDKTNSSTKLVHSPPLFAPPHTRPTSWANSKSVPDSRRPRRFKRQVTNVRVDSSSGSTSEETDPEGNGGGGSISSAPLNDQVQPEPVCRAKSIYISPKAAVSRFVSSMVILPWF